MTHVVLEDGTVFEVLNVIDDHSRLCIASRAMVTVKGPDVVRVLHQAASRCGYPAAFLTDIGLIFTGNRTHGLAGALEQELWCLGITAKHSRPYHPQTCGKVERFHQTMKRFLAAPVPPEPSFKRTDADSASTRSTSPDRSRSVTRVGSITSASEAPTRDGEWRCSSRTGTSRASASTDRRCGA